MSAGRPARLAVGVVSAGRVGAVVGAALGRRRAPRRRRLRGLPGVGQPGRGAAARTSRCVPPDEVVAGADLALLAVPDDVLPGLVRGLAAAGCFRPGQIVVHTSGAHGVAVLDPAAEHGVLPLALHPVMTFTGRTEDVARLAGCSVGVTATAGDEAAWSVGEALVVEMGAEPVRVRRGGPPALPRGARARRQPPGHARPRLRRDPGAGRRPPGRAAGRPAAVGRAGQRAAPRRPRAHRPGRPRRRRHRAHPPARARRRRPRPGRDLPRAGRAAPPAGPRPPGCCPTTPPTRCCATLDEEHDAVTGDRRRAHPRRLRAGRADRAPLAGRRSRRSPARCGRRPQGRAGADDGRAARGPPRADPARPPRARRRRHRRVDLREPAAVRRRRGPRPLPAPARGRPARSAARRASSWCSLPGVRRHVPRGRRHRRSRPGPLGDRAGGRGAARATSPGCSRWWRSCSTSSRRTSRSSARRTTSSSC